MIVNHDAGDEDDGPDSPLGRERAREQRIANTIERGFAAAGFVKLDHESGRGRAVFVGKLPGW